MIFEEKFLQAITDYNQAIELDPDDEKVYNNRGLAAYIQKSDLQARQFNNIYCELIAT